MIRTSQYNNKQRYLIRNIRAREILDSIGNPTIEVDVITDIGIGRASVPSGSSVGSYEMVEIRDRDPSRYHSMGVLNAINNINKKIKPLLIGRDVRKQKLIDELMIELDGSSNKKNLGANAILAVSIGVAKIASSSLNLPLYRYLGGINAHTLPIPSFNVINGGKHAGNNLTFQEFMIQPVLKTSFSNSLRIGSEIYHTLKSNISKNYGIISTNVG